MTERIEREAVKRWLAGERKGYPHWKDDPPHDVDEWCDDCAVPYADKQAKREAVKPWRDAALARHGEPSPWPDGSMPLGCRCGLLDCEFRALLASGDGA